MEKNINKQITPGDPENWGTSSPQIHLWCLSDGSPTWIQDWQNKCLLSESLSRFISHLSNAVNHSFRECCLPLAKVYRVCFIQQIEYNSVLKGKHSFMMQPDKIQFHRVSPTAELPSFRDTEKKKISLTNSGRIWKCPSIMWAVVNLKLTLSGELGWTQVEEMRKVCAFPRIEEGAGLLEIWQACECVEWSQQP